MSSFESFVSEQAMLSFRSVNVFGPTSANTWKRLVDKVANHDLTNRIAVFLLEATYPLETVSIFLLIKENSDAGIRGNFVERVLLEASKVPAGLS